MGKVWTKYLNRGASVTGCPFLNKKDNLTDCCHLMECMILLYRASEPEYLRIGKHLRTCKMDKKTKNLGG